MSEVVDSTATLIHVLADDFPHSSLSAIATQAGLRMLISGLSHPGKTMRMEAAMEYWFGCCREQFDKVIR